MLLWLGQLVQDLRYALRRLASDPAFAAIAIGSLALGIGASTAMYSVIYAVILDPFPYKNVDELMSIQVGRPDHQTTYYTVDQYLEFAERSTIFSGVIASTVSDVTWTGNGEPQRLRGNYCSIATFDVMGVPPLAGRATLPSDALPGAEPVAVLSYRFWVKQFAGDTSVIGRRMQLNGVTRTVIGVMPKRFMFRGPDVYLPTVFHRGETIDAVRTVHVLGRLKPGVTAERAEADLRPIVEELQRRTPKPFPDGWSVGLLSFQKTFPSDLGEALWILFGAVGLLLLIACVNVSNLILSKSAARRREIAVRASLGATRVRLVRQLLAETAALAFAGGALGIALAYAGLRAIIAMVPEGTIPDESEIVLDLPVLFFALGVCLIATMIAGVAPALQMSGRNVATPMKEAARGSSGSRTQHWLRNTLIVGEVALSLMLLAGAALMIRALIATENQDYGMNPGQLLTLEIDLSAKRYPSLDRRAAFFDDLIRRVAAIPGTAAAGVDTGLHPWGAPEVIVEIPGRPAPDQKKTLIHQVTEGYLQAMGIKPHAGRTFTQSDVARKAPIALVNETFVRRHFAGEGDALGRIVRIPRIGPDPLLPASMSVEIVGIVRDRINQLGDRPPIWPEILIPYTIAPQAGTMLVVLANGPADILAKPVRAQVYALDADQSLTDVQTMESALRKWAYARPRFNMFLFSLFAALGLLLALCGVYGVISTAVTQRTQEIGIRMALGADSRQVTGMVLSGGAKLLALGIAAGLAGSLMSVRLLESEVRNLQTAFDYPAFAAVSAILLAAGLLACLVPAWRASRVDPLNALRHE